MRNKIKYGLTFLLIITLFSTLSAQKTLVYEQSNVLFNKAMELYNKEKYADAQKFFKKYLRKADKESVFKRTDAEYYRARCAMFLFNRDADVLMQNFIKQHKESPHYNEAVYQMALFQYQKKKYAKAYKWFKRTDKYYINKEDYPEFYFKYGYSAYESGKLDKAALYFYNILDSTESEYNSPAIYYYAHIAYTQKKYETALQKFKELQDDDLFAPIVPYYITQILYLQEKYDEVIKYATPFINSVSEKRYPEIARILGEAHYKRGEYKKAVPYLEIYKEKGLDYGRDDTYELAYSYFKSGEYQKAIENFKTMLSPKDELTQMAYIAMAESFLKLNDKKGAMMAFFEASKLKFDEKVAEKSLFNYAKLSYELSDSPFNDAIKAFTDFIKKYPDSKYTDDAYYYLSQVYLTTKNYQAAIDAYEHIKNITKDVEIAYQRITFFRGVELYKNGNYQAAIINFDKSINNSKFNKKILAEALYWRAEAYYNLRRYKDAADGYKSFILTPGSFLLREYKLAHYNLAYCYFKQKKYSEATTWFRKFIDQNPDENPDALNDAYIRTADCLFMQRKYDMAAEYYDKAIELGKRDVDYALFQKGFALGLQKKYNEKIIVLSKLVSDYPNSPYADDAVYEMGESYFATENNDMAINTFNTLVTDYPNSPYVTKAYLKLGLLYVNKNQPEEALEAYKSVIQKYPNTQEAKQSIELIKNIYTNELSDADGFIEFTKEAHLDLNIDETQADSLSYRTAEKVYMRGDCDKSKELFAKYINKYKNGRYLLNAHFYKAECNFQAGEEAEAFESYKYVGEQAKNEFTEQSLLKASEIALNQGKYEEAIPLLKRLQKLADRNKNISFARLNIMRAYYNIKDYKNAIKSAINVLKDPKIDDNIYREAHYIIASSFYKQGDYQAAFDEYQLLAEDVKTKEGAEAKYRIAEILFKDGKIDEAESEINDFRTQNSPFAYWLAKAYILWADIFKAKKDYFYATATLQSIIDNYANKTDGIVDEATEKLTALEEEQETDEELNNAAEENIIEEINEIDKLIDDEPEQQEQNTTGSSEETENKENKSSEN